MSCCSVTAKVVIILISLAFWGAAGVFSFLAWAIFNILKDYEGLEQESTDASISGNVLIAIAVFLFIIGLFGYIGAGTENKCCLISFLIMVILILILEVAVVVLGFIFLDIVKDGLKISLEQLWGDYNIDDVSKETANSIEEAFKCCGVNGPSDYLTLPSSCCPPDDTTICTTINVYQTGCYDAFAKVLDSGLVYIGVGAGVIGFTQILALGFTCYLLCRDKREIRTTTSMAMAASFSQA